MDVKREVAEGFGADAQRYHRARPDYPAGLVERVIAGSPSRGVLDVGMGTGIAAALFRQADCTVLGVEPDPRMARLARSAGLEVEVARFEEWDAAGRTFGTVIAAQAWHWVDMTLGAAKAAEALAAGGRLVVFWNSFLPPAEVNQAMGAVYRRALPDLPLLGNGMPGPNAYQTLCDKAAEGMAAAGAAAGEPLFGEPEHWRFDWAQDYTTGEWLDAVQTFGGWGRIAPARQSEILDAVGEAIDGFGGGFPMGYATVAVAAARLRAARL